MGSAIEEYGMTLLNSDILVCGGVWTSNCTLYASADNVWTTFPPLPTDFSDFPMITLHGTRPYMFGGVNWSSYTASNTVYSYDKTNAWTPRAPVEQPLWQHTAVAIDASTAMVCGGLTTTNINSTQSQCSTYTVCICGVFNSVRIILVRQY